MFSYFNIILLMFYGFHIIILDPTLHLQLLGMH